MRRPRLLAPAILILLAIAVVSPRDSEATTFNPFFGPNDFYTLSPTTPGANSDVHAQFNLNAPSSNVSPLFGNTTFADSDVLIADSATIPRVGAYMGHTDMVAALGLASEGCNSTVPITFNLVESSTDTSARSITNGGAMTLTGGIGAADTTLTYGHPLDPMGVRADGLPVNEIQIGSEDMLIAGVNTASNTYTVVRGWNGTAAASHSAGAEIKRVNVIYPSGPATNLLVNLAEDDGDLDNNGVPEFAPGFPGGSSFNGNYVADGSDAVPSFVRDSFDPNVNADDGGAIPARARYMGLTWVAGTQLTVYQLVTGNPGALATLPNLDWATPAWGYPVVAFWQDQIGSPSNTAITDFCNFSSNTTLFGVPHDNACTTSASPALGCTGTAAGFTFRLAVDNGCHPQTPVVQRTFPNECGLSASQQLTGECDPGPPVECICPTTTCPRQTNPATSQSLRFYQYAVSQRDYDDDGHQNALDTCHSDPNPNWDPRQINSLSGDDIDGDGIPQVCDPTSNSQFPGDEDGDGWWNRIDSCPTVVDTAPGGGAGIAPNTFMWDQDVPAGQPVPDGGPHADDIAPACDFAGESCAGCPVLTATGANGHYHATAATQTVCIGAATSECNNIPGLAGGPSDGDGDGVVNASDTCRDGTNPPIAFTLGPGATTLSSAAGAGATTLNVTSTAGMVQGIAVVIASPAETLRYITSIGSNSISIGVGLSAAHSAGATVRMLSFAQSMRDLNNDGFVDIADIAFLTGVFGSQGGDPSRDGVGDPWPSGYQGRYDTNYDSFVDISDVTSLTGMFGAACGPP